MLVNGRPWALTRAMTLPELLAELRIDPQVVVVMHGDRIHRGNSIPDTPLAAGDVIEIVTMMQGG